MIGESQMEVDGNRLDEIARQGLRIVLWQVLILGGMGFASVFAGTLSANPLFDGRSESSRKAHQA